jgi:hypothetical protein
MATRGATCRPEDPGLRAVKATVTLTPTAIGWPSTRAGW